jgi:hypothetical protein
MTGAEEVVFSIIIISTISNMAVDVFGEVLLEYGVRYTREFFPNFSIPGFGDHLPQKSSAMGGADLSAMIEKIRHTPQLLQKLSVEQLDMLNTVLVSLQGTS